MKNLILGAMLCMLIKYKTVVSSRSYLLSTQLYDVKTDFMCECMLKELYGLSV